MRARQAPPDRGWRALTTLLTDLPATDLDDRELAGQISEEIPPDAVIITGPAVCAWPFMPVLTGRSHAQASALAAVPSPAAIGSQLSSRDFAGLENVDGLGDLAGAPGAAAELAEDVPDLELGVYPFSR